MTISTQGPRVFVMEIGSLRGDDDAATCICPDGTCLSAQNDNDNVVGLALGGDPTPVDIDPEYYAGVDAFVASLNAAGIDLAGAGEDDGDEDMFVEEEDDSIDLTDAVLQLGRSIEAQNTATALYASIIAKMMGG